MSAEDESRYPILTYGPTQEVAKAKGVARAERIAKQSGKKFAIQNESYSKFSGGTLWKCRLDVYFYRGENNSNDFFSADLEQSLQSSHQCLLYDRSETQFLTGQYEQVTQALSSGTETKTASYSVYLLDNQFNGYWIGENSSLYLTGLLQKEAQEETLSIRAFVQKRQSESFSFSYQISCSQENPGLKISLGQDQNGVEKGQELLRSDLYEAWNSHEQSVDRLLAVASILLEAHQKGLDTIEDSEPLSFRPTEKIVHQWMTSWPGNAHAYYDLGEDKLLKKSFRVTEKSANITSFSGMKVSFAPKKENTLVIYCPQLKFKGTTYYVKGILELVVEKKSSSEIAQKYYGRFYQELQKIADIVSSETMEKAATLNQEISELPR